MIEIPSQFDLLLTAMQYVGQKEIPGKKHNSLIIEWTRQLIRWASSDEIPWCSTFLQAVAKKAGYHTTGATAAARSWLKVGYEVDHPEPGDLAVFWRYSPHSWKGHVGIVVNVHDGYVWVLGGNQSNMVNVAPYPISRLLSYRKLIKK